MLEVLQSLLPVLAALLSVLAVLPVTRRMSERRCGFVPVVRTVRLAVLTGQAVQGRPPDQWYHGIARRRSSGTVPAVRSARSGRGVERRR